MEVTFDELDKRLKDCSPNPYTEEEFKERHRLMVEIVHAASPSELTSYTTDFLRELHAMLYPEEV